MEFKFGAVDGRPPQSSAAVKYFSSERTIQGQSVLPTWATRLNPTPDPNPNPDPTPFRDPILYPTNARDAVLRQLEKDKIREEILAAERRRVLEAEVRRELMMEAEQIKPGGVVKSDHPRVDPSQFGSRGTYPEPAGVTSAELSKDALNGQDSDADKDKEKLKEKLIMYPHHSELNTDELVPPSLLSWINKDKLISPPHLSGFNKDSMIFPFRLSELNKDKLISPPHLSGLSKDSLISPHLSELNEDKMIVLAKPSPDVSGAKRKTPPTEAASPPYLKKMHREGWSCAFCQVKATKENVFNDHLNGKKHKRMLRKENLRKNFCKNTTKLLDTQCALKSNSDMTGEANVSIPKTNIDMTGEANVSISTAIPRESSDEAENGRLLEEGSKNNPPTTNVDKEADANIPTTTTIVAASSWSAEAAENLKRLLQIPSKLRNMDDASYSL